MIIYIRGQGSVTNPCTLYCTLYKLHFDSLCTYKKKMYREVLHILYHCFGAGPFSVVKIFLCGAAGHLCLLVITKITVIINVKVAYM